MLEINKINKDATKREEKKKEKNKPSQESSRGSAKSKKEQSPSRSSEEEKSESDKSADHTYPCTMTKKERLKKFKTFGRVSDDDDGRIIKDENEEIIEVDTDTCKKMFHYY